MKLDMIADAPLVIQIHLATVIPAFFIGSWLIFLSAKGSKPHRLLGVIYMTLMVATAISSFFIRSLDPPHLTWIHLFIPLTLIAITSGLISLRRGDIRGHQRAMIILYVGALLIAGGFTFVPGRLMHAVFFS